MCSTNESNVGYPCFEDKNITFGLFLCKNGNLVVLEWPLPFDLDAAGNPITMIFNSAVFLTTTLLNVIVISDLITAGTVDRIPR